MSHYHQPPTQSPVKLYYSTSPAPEELLAEDIKAAPSPSNQLIYHDKPTKSFINDAHSPHLHHQIKAQHLYRIPAQYHHQYAPHHPSPAPDSENVKIHYYTPITYTTPSSADYEESSHEPQQQQQPQHQQHEEARPYQGPKYLPTQAAPTTHSPSPTTATPPHFYPTSIAPSTQPPPVSTFHPTLSYYYQRHQNRPSRIRPALIGRSKTISTAELDKQAAHHEPLPTPEQHINTQIVPADTLNSGSLAILLRQLQQSNHLPETITADNIDNSIRTLVKILNNLKKNKDQYSRPPTTEKIAIPDAVDYDYKYYEELG